MTTQTPLAYGTRFETHLTAIHQWLAQCLEPREPQRLWQAMQHGVLNGGKRIRPVILLETTMACGGMLENALPTACALELIHCYSLIHDDLPCMDDDDLRRGQPTVHKAFSEDIAILAGDALLAMAFGQITDKTPSSVPARDLLDIISRLSAVAGVQGLVNGQADDILSVHSVPNEGLLTRIHHGKTAALFGFATWAGARLAGLQESDAHPYRQFGEQLGLAFQMVDDLLDVTGEASDLGKTPGKDKAQGKITFPAVFGVAQTQAILKETMTQLNDTLASLPGLKNSEGLATLVSFVEARRA